MKQNIQTQLLGKVVGPKKGLEHVWNFSDQPPDYQKAIIQAVFLDNHGEVKTIISNVINGHLAEAYLTHLKVLS